MIIKAVRSFIFLFALLAGVTVAAVSTTSAFGGPVTSALKKTAGNAAKKKNHGGDKSHNKETNKAPAGEETPAQKFMRDFGIKPDNQAQMMSLMFVGILALIALTLVTWVVSLWGIFEKAGHPGWFALIPLLNIFTLMRIAKMPNWSLLVIFLPAVGGIWAGWMAFALAREFGKSRFYGLGLFFAPIIFYPHLAFGSSQYRRQYGTGEIPYRMVA